MAFIGRLISLFLAAMSAVQILLAVGGLAQTPEQKKADAEKAKKDAEQKAEDAKKKAMLKKAIELSPQGRAATKAQQFLAGTPVNLNTATEAELLKLKGVNKKTAQQIIAARPFKTTGELVSKKILTVPGYKAIEKRVTIQ